MTNASNVAGTVNRQDRIALLVTPALLLVVALFLCPFVFGLVLSFSTHQGGGFGNYIKFFSTAFQRETIWTTLWLSLPTTLINIGLALPIAFVTRRHPFQRTLTTVLVVPIRRVASTRRVARLLSTNPPCSDLSNPFISTDTS